MSSSGATTVTAVVRLRADLLDRKTPNHKLGIVNDEVDTWFVKRIVEFTTSCVIAESPIDFEFIETDDFLGTVYEYYLRGDTVLDHEAERKRRIRIAHATIAWVSEYFSKRSFQLQNIRNTLKPTPLKSETHEEYLDRWSVMMGIAMRLAWNVFKTNQKFSEPLITYVCHRCGKRFEQESSRGFRVPVRCETTKFVRFCSGDCLDLFEERELVVQYFGVVQHVLNQSKMPPQLIRRIINTL